MKYHLIAIGGSIMHNLAIELQQLGNVVTGSDDIIVEPALSNLKNLQLLPEQLGWFPEKIHQEIDIVIVGMHAKPDNPELLRAQKLGLKVMSFPEFIYHHAEHKQRIVIAGSHGKTTVTSMILHVLNHIKYPTDYLVGAKIQGFDTMVKLSDAPIFVMEGDEYLSAPFDSRPKFLHYKPHVLVITGIAWDHINVFPTEQEYIRQFDLLMASLEKATSIIYNENDKKVKTLVQKYQKEESFYFIPYQPLATTKDKDRLIVKIEQFLSPIQIFGEHNLANMSAAWEVCKLLAVSPSEFLQAMSEFKGAAKRLEIVYQDQWNVIISDFAHSPSKVAASIKAVVNRFPKANIIACLELHTFSSLNKNFIKGYKDVFKIGKTLTQKLVPVGKITPKKQVSSKIVFIDKKIAENKRMEIPTPQEVKDAFSDPDIIVCYESTELLKWIKSSKKSENNVFLMMSSGNFAGLSFKDML